MSFHTLAFFSSVAQGALNQVNSISDPVFKQLSNGYQMRSDMRDVVHVFGVSTNLERIQLQAPSLRDQPFPTFMPNNRGALFESPPRTHDLREMPLRLQPYEELDAFIEQDAVGSQNVFVFLNLFDAAPGRVTGKFLRVRFTGTTTLAANAWTAVTPTLDQALDVGKYAVVGMFARSPTALAARIIPQAGTIFRPGGVAVQNFDQLLPPWMDPGALGVWTVFDSTQLPQIEYFATAADTAEEGILVLMRQ